MNSDNTLPLNDDILARILKFCPTFGTLEANILVSQSFYRAFQSNPKTITRAVAYNIVGPALPQALRVARYPYYEFESTGADPLGMATTCPEDEDIDVITAEEKQTLETNSKMVAELEDIYSLKCKDRTSKTSVLTSAESYRFCRAMYRIILYGNLFPDKRFYGDELYDFDEILDDDIIPKVQRQRKAVLEQYSTDDLHQLYSVVKFLRGILESVTDLPANRNEANLSLGPYVALRAYQDRESLEVEEQIVLFRGYFSVPLQSIWTARKIAPPNESEPASTWVLDQINGEDDTCSQCSAVDGVDLFAEANWSRFETPLQELLKGNLRHNPIVNAEFSAATVEIDNSDALGPFIGELFALRSAAEFTGWMREDSYCYGCLTRFLQEHVWRWFLAERVKAGWTPPQDCEDGWGCAIQIDPSHAETKNHLCVPAIGEKASASFVSKS